MARAYGSGIAVPYRITRIGVWLASGQSAGIILQLDTLMKEYDGGRSLAFLYISFDNRYTTVLDLTKTMSIQFIGA